ncbi:MAG: bifunctional diaminohydroxyphosphoribosylaminopyrimidine deaminase/5-amino-6-(5-phosphoribosylamino)uracil reductase RibD [Dehalococcoidia bacterium]|nr:bifunctional diaminohydroxyphosphoribosylaminopyrimidine deaminase/5-amino-6-(5-phosphoribosylamino)uracil reductase RibD [Dehalococcoidia bacterium]
MNYMRRAVTLASQALGSTSPNPAVGAVVVKNGEIVGEGFTQPPGGDHAEVVAIKQAGALAKGATLYVTLEPCNHLGRTPPCTDSIITSGISIVHAAVRDPNPDVAGGGLERLEAGGVRTHFGAEAAAVQRQLEAWVKFVTTGRPFITAKFAMSLDGKIATHTGDSKWITGDKARWHVHKMRAGTDAIMVGIGTVLADDPRLTARDEKGNPMARQPLRVVVDTLGRLPATARLLKEPGETLLAVGPGIDQLQNGGLGNGTNIRQFPVREGHIDLERLIEFLAEERDVTNIMVEGGGTLLGGLFDLGLVDKVVAFVAPTVIGGKGAPSPVSGSGVELMADALQLERVRWKRLGRDMLITGYC